MWTTITRPKYRRDGLRYTSDTTDAEWAVIEPFLPPPHKGRGRPRTTPSRAVMNAIFYLAQSGCQWRLLPKDFPPYTTVQHYFYPWRESGLWRQINHVLLMLAREAAGRDASPSAGVIDSQSVKTAEAGGDTHHYQLTRAFRNIGADIRLEDKEFGEPAELCNHLDAETAHFVRLAERLYSRSLGPWCAVEVMSVDWMKALAEAFAVHFPEFVHEPYFEDCSSQHVEERHADESLAVTELVLKQRLGFD